MISKLLIVKLYLTA